MAEIALENERISNFQGLVTLTLDRVILHTVVHHTPNFMEIEDTLWTDGCTYGRTNGHLIHTLLGRLKKVDLKNVR